MIAQFAGTTNKAGNAMGVFFTFCFISFYGGGIDVVSYVYCSEIFPTHIRSQGMAWSIVGTFLSTLVYVEAGPTALANIQWKYYLVFVCLTFVNIVIIYFWLPEASLVKSNAEEDSADSNATVDQRSLSGGDQWTLRRRSSRAFCRRD